MRVVIRVDSSPKMGSGHLMRCLALADALCKVSPAKVTFICRDTPGNLIKKTIPSRYALLMLPYDEAAQLALLKLSEHKQWLGATLDSDKADTLMLLNAIDELDLLVVDHYALDECWETPMRQCVKKIMVIDDLADRKHDCDILLDQNYYKHLDDRYNGLIPSSCKKLLGPRYAILREEFCHYRPSKPRKISFVKKILVNFGGADPQKYSLRLIKLLKNNFSHFSQYEFLFITGSMSSCKTEVFEISKNLPNCTAIEKTSEIAKIMNEVDLFIGAAGSTSWERGMLALPAIICSVAKNQEKIAIDGNRVFHVLLKNMFDPVALANTIQSVHLLESISSNSFRIMSGWSFANIIQEII